MAECLIIFAAVGIVVFALASRRKEIGKYEDRY